MSAKSLNDSLTTALEVLRDGCDRVIETSCAVVILRGERAYKLKKDVDYGFLDFTSPQKRAAALHRELRYNQRLAAHIYLGVEEIGGESVLVMQRFDTEAVLAELAGADWQPGPDLLRDLGRTIATFHAGSEICRDDAHADNIKYVIDTSRANFDLFRDKLGGAEIDAYDAAIAAAYEALRGDLLNRFDHGFVRHCHGDMHLGNILVENGGPVLFDCIEFNERLSQIDVLYDLAFLLMDLWVRGQHAAANRIMNVWLEQAARLEDDPTHVYAGLKLLPLYMSARAGVRCHVSAHQGSLDAARMYLRAAHAFLDEMPARLLAVGGLSGSGKSTRARELAPETGRAPGAVVLRSDEVRKRLWACPELEALPPQAYTDAENARVHHHMFDLAAAALRNGQAVVLDATFREAQWRDAAEALATGGIAFSGLWLDVPGDERARRIASRSRDVSDATQATALGQQAIDETLLYWPVERPPAP